MADKEKDKDKEKEKDPAADPLADGGPVAPGPGPVPLTDLPPEERPDDLPDPAPATQVPGAKKPKTPKVSKGDRQNSAAILMDPAKDQEDGHGRDGEALYTAYRKAADGRNHRGEPLPNTFDDLTDERQEVWHRTAIAFHFPA